ncbi:MAG: transposase [Bacteroidota bacterium]
MRYKILDQNGLNFLTLTVVEWIDLFTRPVYSDMLIDSLRYCIKEKDLILFAYVIMPSHLHMIARTDNTTGLSPILQSFKSFTANQILKYLKNKDQAESRREWLLNHFAFNTRRNKNHSQYQIWQRDNHPIALYSPKVIRQKLDYTHYNPVHGKIVAAPEHYLYSSASNYLNGTGLLEVSILEDIFGSDVGYVHVG